jgi:hypothetical protein
MYESKIQQLNSASMRVRKIYTSEKPFSKTQETFSPKAFYPSWKKAACKTQMCNG